MDYFLRTQNLSRCKRSKYCANSQNNCNTTSSSSNECKKNVDAESLKEQQRTEAINFQKEMYSGLLKRKSQGKLKVEIQDVEVTNAMLRKIDVDKLLTMTPVEMGQLLKADAVVKSNF